MCVLLLPHRLVQALLRIVKHAEDNLPGQSAGGLLGLDMPRGESQGSVMQVTYAFAMPRARDAYGDGMMDDDGDEDRIGNEREFARQTMKLLKDVSGSRSAGVFGGGTKRGSPANRLCAAGECGQQPGGVVPHDAAGPLLGGGDEDRRQRRAVPEDTV
jgi:hypothetical protein